MELKIGGAFVAGFLACAGLLVLIVATRSPSKAVPAPERDVYYPGTEELHPDEDSLSLTRQLLKVPKENARGAGPNALGIPVSRFHNGLARALNGLEIADNLGIPDDVWQYSEYPMRAVLTPLERLRRAIPGASRLVAHASNTIIRKDLERILGGREPSYG